MLSGRGELRGQLGPRAAGLEPDEVLEDAGRVEVRGTYVTHGNREGDLLRMGRGAGLHGVEVRTLALYDSPCGDPDCAGCRTDKLRAVDVEALAGSWDLGAVREGFQVVHRVALPGGFGNEVIEANRPLLGDFAVETGDEGEWTALKDVPFIFGTPPCSGWSVMNTSKGINARGASSAVQQCTWALVRYAGRTYGGDGGRGPEVVAFECVQQAFTQGRDLMSAYLHLLRRETGQDYQLTHVKMSGASVGAAQYRARYFFVAHRVPFGVEVQSPRLQLTYGEAIGDLQGMELRQEFQPYTRAADGEFQRDHRSKSGGTDWHLAVSDGSGETNVHLTMRILAAAGVDWEPGMDQRAAIRRLAEAGRLPERAKKWIAEDGSVKGWGGPKRISADRTGFVIHGGGASQFIHWAEPRWLTARELTRVMGYPDDWTYPYTAKVSTVGAWIGKNCPVESARWISRWIRRSLDGEPGELRGASDEREHEFLLDVTHAYRGPDRIVAA